jgi:hypothetical protein
LLEELPVELEAPVDDWVDELAVLVAEPDDVVQAELGLLGAVRFPPEFAIET